MRVPTLSYVAAFLLVGSLTAGCSAAEGEHDPAATNDDLVWTPLPTTLAPWAVSPCDVAWQIPTRKWPLLQPLSSTFPAPFQEFESKLYAGHALWFGKYAADGAPHRAVVEVDLVRDADKKLESKLWYLAILPYTAPPDPMSPAMDAIGVYTSREPVDSIVLGYCLDDNSFLGNRWSPVGARTPAPVVPPNHKIRTVVTMYDPRCTCSAATVRTTAVVGVDTWAAAAR